MAWDDQHPSEIHLGIRFTIPMPGGITPTAKCAITSANMSATTPQPATCHSASAHAADSASVPADPVSGSDLVVPVADADTDEAAAEAAAVMCVPQL